MKKLVLTIALATSMMLGLTACGSDASDTSKRDYDLYIYNSKGENATQFEDMAKQYEAETGVRVKTFSIGSGQDHMETLRAEMNSNNKPSIFSIQGLKELTEWKEGGFVVDFNTLPDSEFKSFSNTIDQSLRLTTDNSNSYGVPYNVEGYGYIADTKMIEDLFNVTDASPILTDIEAATYEEWTNLVLAIEDFIVSPNGQEVVLNGNTYNLASEKTELTSNLNGVFNVMGSQKWTYGDHFINVSMNTKFSTPSSSANATDEEIKAFKPELVKYAQALDFKTSHLAGADDSMVRGQAFISEANTGYDQTVQNFADGKGVFLKQGNWAFTNIKNASEEVSQRLVFLPVKMPMTDEDFTNGLTPDKFNKSIPVYVPNYYAINTKVSEEEQQVAMDFLLWLNTSESGEKIVTESFEFIPYNADPSTGITLPNSLGNSIIAYMAKGNTLQAPYLGAPPTWAGETVGLKIMEEYMTKEVWDEKDYNDIADYAVEQWISLRNQ